MDFETNKELEEDLLVESTFSRCIAVDYSCLIQNHGSASEESTLKASSFSASPNTCYADKTYTKSPFLQ